MDFVEWIGHIPRNRDGKNVLGIGLGMSCSMVYTATSGQVEASQRDCVTLLPFQMTVSGVESVNYHALRSKLVYLN